MYLDCWVYYFLALVIAPGFQTGSKALLSYFSLWYSWCSALQLTNPLFPHYFSAFVSSCQSNPFSSFWLLTVTVLVQIINRIYCYSLLCCTHSLWWKRGCDTYLLALSLYSLLWNYHHYYHQSSSSSIIFHCH